MMMFASPESAGAEQLAQPRVWVVKWVDYTSKYGLGYLLSDGSVGVHFTDLTKIVMSSDGVHFEYVPDLPHDQRPRDPATGRRIVPPQAHTVDSYPADLKKKVTLLVHFRGYLLEHWRKATEDGSALPADVTSVATGSGASGLVFMKRWLHTDHAAVFRLSDRTVQAAFFDGSSVVLSPDAASVIFTDKRGERSAHPLASVMTSGRRDVVKRLRYVRDLLARLVNPPGAAGAD